jgi:hypothetical protein
MLNYNAFSYSILRGIRPGKSDAAFGEQLFQDGSVAATLVFAIAAQ